MASGLDPLTGGRTIHGGNVHHRSQVGYVQPPSFRYRLPQDARCKGVATGCKYLLLCSLRHVVGKVFLRCVFLSNFKSLPWNPSFGLVGLCRAPSSTRPGMPPSAAGLALTSPKHDSGALHPFEPSALSFPCWVSIAFLILSYFLIFHTFTF